MKRKLLLSMLVLFFISGAFAQSTDEKPMVVFENLYIQAKKGMEDKFEAAVKAHDDKFHPDGPYKAGLRKVEYGDMVGWYVWIFGPTTYSSLDSRPTKEGGHADDWAKTVDPLVETYGETELWNYEPDLSFGMDILKKSKYYEVWAVDLKRGDYYKFKALAEKLKKVYESVNTDAFMVFTNPIHTNNKKDVGILWSFNSYDSWSKDSGIKAAYEKMFGAGTWQNMLDDWTDMTVDYNSEIRSILK
jgi:hypothetical protein